MYTFAASRKRACLLVYCACAKWAVDFHLLDLCTLIGCGNGELREERSAVFLARFAGCSTGEVISIFSNMSGSVQVIIIVNR